MIVSGEIPFGPRKGGKWNTFKVIREALDLKTDREHLEDFLHWWTTMSPEEHHMYRTIDLSKVQDYDLPEPPKELRNDPQ